MCMCVYASLCVCVYIICVSLYVCVCVVKRCRTTLSTGEGCGTVCPVHVRSSRVVC